MTAGANNIAKFDIKDTFIKLSGPNSIIGRTMVVSHFYLFFTLMPRFFSLSHRLCKSAYSVRSMRRLMILEKEEMKKALRRVMLAGAWPVELLALPSKLSSQNEALKSSPRHLMRPR